jgi:hypothetical protein
LQYECALGTELENIAPLLQSLLAFLEGCQATNPQRVERSQPTGHCYGQKENL